VGKLEEVTSGSLFQPAQSCGSTTAKAHSKPSAEHRQIRVSKMMKCCLVLVQRNKSFRTEVTLHLDQLCRKICQGSAKRFRANAETRCAAPIGGFIAKSMYIYRRDLTCCRRAMPALRWGRRQTKSMRCPFFSQIH